MVKRRGKPAARKAKRQAAKAAAGKKQVAAKKQNAKRPAARPEAGGQTISEPITSFESEAPAFAPRPGYETSLQKQLNWRALVAFILVCELAGVMGSIFTAPSLNSWYDMLAKPFFTPPPWVFAPVWFILYAWMGIAAYIVWQNRRDKTPEVVSAFIFFALQLIVNVKWSLLFFGFHSPFYGLIAIFVLLTLIIITAVKFFRIDERAGLLFLPYIAWVIFAALLNAVVWLMNP